MEIEWETLQREHDKDKCDNTRDIDMEEESLIMMDDNSSDNEEEPSEMTVVAQ